MASNRILIHNSKAGPGNPAPGVGGTAQDGGISTAATVADGGPSEPQADPNYSSM